MLQRFWKLKFHWGRKLEGFEWFRGWVIHFRDDDSIRWVVWRMRIFGINIKI